MNTVAARKTDRVDDSPEPRRSMFLPSAASLPVNGRMAPTWMVSPEPFGAGLLQPSALAHASKQAMDAINVEVARLTRIA